MIHALCGGIGPPPASTPVAPYLAHAGRAVYPNRMRNLGKSVVLVGMMGAGKSSIGRRLATTLGVAFHDADSEIEAAAGCSINEIFERYGEDAFREGERRVLARLLSEAPHVLATGGGAFADPETRA